MKSWASGMDWTNRGRRQSARTHLCHIFHRLHLLHLLIWYTCPPVCAGLSGSNAGGSRRGRSFRYPALAAPAVAVNSSHWHEIAFCDSWEATASNKLRLYYTHTIYIGRLHSGSQRKWEKVARVVCPPVDVCGSESTWKFAWHRKQEVVEGARALFILRWQAGGRKKSPGTLTIRKCVKSCEKGRALGEWVWHSRHANYKRNFDCGPRTSIVGGRMGSGAARREGN